MVDIYEMKNFKLPASALLDSILKQTNIQVIFIDVIRNKPPSIMVPVIDLNGKRIDQDPD